MREKNVFEMIDEEKLNPLIKPYWEGGITLEPYYEDNKFKEVVSVGKKTFQPMAKDTVMAIAESFLSWGSDNSRRELIEERQQHRPCWGWNYL